MPRLALRLSKPIVDRCFTWGEAEIDKVVGESPIAIRYAPNQRLVQRFLKRWPPADPQLSPLRWKQTA